MNRLVGRYLRIEETSERFFQDSPYDLVVATHPHRQNIARYYITHLTDHLPEKVFSLSGFSQLEAFRRFQSQLLEETFFSLNNDLRWNLYLILVIPDDQRFPDETVLQIVERDENYARKAVLRSQELESYLQRIILRKSRQQGEATRSGAQLISAWLENLQAVGLDGCLELFYERKIEKYCAGEQLVSSSQLRAESVNGGSDDSDSSRIEAIKKIIMRDFRPHCFSKEFELEPGHVSLLFGPNGSGKTSILEGVELAATGEIKRLKGCPQEEGTVSILCVDEGENEVVIGSEHSVAQCKQREQAWYGVPGGRGKCTLGINFSRFNYLDCEAAYRFASEQQDESGYNRSISQLFFGEEIIRMEQNLERHRQGFDEKHKKLEKVLREKKDTLQEKKAALEELEIDEGLDDRLILAEVVKSGRNIGMKRRFDAGASSPTVEVKQTLAIYQAVSYNLESIKKQAEQLRVVSGVDLKHKKAELEASQARLKAEKERLQGSKRRIEEYKSEVNDHRKKLDEVGRRKAEIANIKDQWSVLERIVQNTAKAKKRKRLEDQKGKLTEELQLLQDLISSHPDIIDWAKDDVAVAPAEVIEEIRLEVLSLEERNKILNENVKQLASQLDSLQSITTQIQSLGVQLSENVLDEGTFSQCPLCGFDHGSPANLKTHIMHKRNQPRTEVQDITLLLHRDINELERLIKAKNNRLESVERARQRVDILRMVLAQLNAGSLMEENLIAEEPEYILAKVQKRFSELESIRNKLHLLENECAILDGQGFTSDLIGKAEQFEKDNLHYKEFLAKQEIQTFVEFLQRQDYLILKQVEQLTEVINSKESVIKDLETEYQDRKTELERRRTRVDSLGVNLEQFCANLGALTEHFEVPEEVGFIKFAERVWLAERHSKAALENLDKISNAKEIRERLGVLEGELKALEREHQRCIVALEALDRVPRTSLFVKDFLDEHRQDIEDLFLRLHIPREFTGIRLTNSSGLQLERGCGNIVDVFQTSFGQRVALALSLLLTLHLTAPSAPKFLILDDPVAHLDDMHLLNLLDVLRELAINGHQLVISTANADISRLLRRKFSFLSKDYKEFSLVRPGNHKVLVFEKTFEHDSENINQRQLQN